MVPITNSAIVPSLSRPTFTPVGGHDVCVWGGKQQTRNFLVLDWKAQRWRNLVSENNTQGDNVPGELHGHSATAYVYNGESYIIIYGGYDTNHDSQSSAYIFSIRERKWIHTIGPQNTPMSDLPPVRNLHTATYVEHNNTPYLFVVGGFHLSHEAGAARGARDRTFVLPELNVLNLHTRKWSLPLPLPARYNHAALYLPSPTSPRVLIMGGRDERGTHTTRHFLIDINAVMRTLQSFEEPSRFGSSGQAHQSERTSMPLGTFSDTIGPFLGDVWLVRDDTLVYLVHQTPQGSLANSAPPPDLFPHAFPTPSYNNECTVWCLEFDRGWGNFSKVRTDKFILAEGSKLVWVGCQDSGLAVSDGEDDVAPGIVRTENVFILLASSVSEKLVVPADHEEIGKADVGEIPSRQRRQWHLSIVPTIDLPPSALARNRHRAEPTPSPAFNYSHHVPLLWDPLKKDVPPSLPFSVSLPDFTIHSSTRDAPPIHAHSIILSSRSSFFHTLLRSELVESFTRAITCDEPYIVVYSLVYFLYTDALPEYLLLNPPSFGRPIGPWHSQAWKIAPALLVASNKYLAPPKLGTLIRQTMLRNPLPSSLPHTSLLPTPTMPMLQAIAWAFRAAYLTAISPAPSLHITSFTSNPNETWLKDLLLEAHIRARKGKGLTSESGLFLDEVVDWAARRLESVGGGETLVLGENNDTDVLESLFMDLDLDLGGNGEGGDDDAGDSQDVDEWQFRIQIEHEVWQEFVEGMRRAGVLSDEARKMEVA